MIVIKALENYLSSVIVALNLVLTSTDEVSTGTPISTSSLTSLLWEDASIGNTKNAYKDNVRLRKRKGKVSVVLNSKALKLSSLTSKHLWSALDLVKEAGRESLGLWLKHTLKGVLNVLSGQSSTIVKLDALFELALKSDTIRLEGWNLFKQAGNKLVILSPTKQRLTNRVCNACGLGVVCTLHIKALLRVCRTIAKNLLLIRCLSSISRRRVAASQHHRCATTSRYHT